MSHKATGQRIHEMTDAPSPPPEEERGSDGRGQWAGRLVVAVPLLALAVVGAAVRIPQLRSGIYPPHEFRQTQTLFPIRDYSEHGINLFFTYLPVYGDQQNVPFELPLYQAVASLPTALGLEVLTSARLVALASFEACALLLVFLLYRWAGTRAAVVAMVLFQFLPFGLLWAAVPLIDFFSVALGLTTVALVDLYTRSGKWPLLVPAALLCWLTLLVKVTTFPAVGILVLLAAYQASLTVARPVVVRRLAYFLAAGPAVGVVWLLLWTHRADEVKGSHPSTAWLTSSALQEWNFGTSEQRGALATYQTVLGRVAQEIAGPGLVVIAVAIVAAVVLRRNRVLVAGLLLAAVAPPLIFLNLFYVHNYYLIAVYPLVVGVAAVGIDLVGSTFRRPVVAWAVSLAVAGGAWWLTSTTPGGAADVAARRPVVVPNALAVELRAVTRPSDPILTVACDWDPTVFYLANRQGLMITGHEPDVDWEATADAGYQYLLACNADPGVVVPPELDLAPTKKPHVFTIEGWQS